MSSPSVITSPRLMPIRSTIWLAQRLVRQRTVGALHRERAVHRIDDAGELDDSAIADQLDGAALMGRDRRVEHGLPVQLRRAESVPFSSAPIRPCVISASLSFPGHSAARIRAASTL